MGQTTKYNPPQPAGSSRPQLMGAGAASAEHNILDAMSSRTGSAGAVKPTRRLWWWLVPLLAAMAWWASQTWVSTPPTRVPAAASVPAVIASAQEPTAPAPLATEVPGVAPAPADSTPHAPSGSVADPFQALDKTTPEPAADTTKSNPVTALQASLEAQAAAAPAQNRKPAGEPAGAGLPTTAPAKPPPPALPAPKAVAVAKAAPPSKPQAQPALPATRKPVEKKTAAKPTQDEGKPVKPAVPTRTDGQDPDVALLSAIMKHLGDGKGTGASVGTAKGSTATRSAQTIAELVKSCKTKDSIEALLCQRRICEGSWGKAEACPIGMAPKAEVADTP